MMAIWYWTGWSSRENTPEGFAKLKGKEPSPGWARERWESPTASAMTHMTAVIGKADAELPDCHVVVNTDNHTFSVGELRDGSHVAYKAGWVRVDYDPNAPDSLKAAHPGELRLRQVRGPIPGTSDPQTLLTVLIRPQTGLVHSSTRAVGPKAAKSIVEDAPWPGIELESPLLWAPYPEFDKYDDLIARSREAFEFFLSAPDPRPVSPPRPAPEPEPEPFARATLRFHVERDTGLTSAETKRIDQLVTRLADARGDGFGLWFPTNESTVMWGESELWGQEPVSDIIEDLELKLDVLTQIRHSLSNTTWDVTLENQSIAWNDQDQRFDPPA